MLANMVGLSPDDVRELLVLLESECKSHNILIIDSRSFLAHNESHIINSINVFYPPFLRYVLPTLPVGGTASQNG